ncbi:MAG: hypothetical protein ABF756_03345 [Liquorilactobacillus ghanensis]|uniref:hypothetical protein n=1 Tax=Liquorilactobacillus ghanensis TaxID=399370 RepID=UPI0039EA5205
MSEWSNYSEEQFKIIDVAGNKLELILLAAIKLVETFDLEKGFLFWRIIVSGVIF